MGESLKLVIFCSILFCSRVFSAKDGIVGFGIDLYQDLCCQSCHDSLSSLYLNCTTFSEEDDMSMDGMDMGMDMDMSMMGMTSEECYATNKPWLETMAYCIQQNCDADGYPEDKQATCFSNQAVAGASEPTFQDSLPAVVPTVELTADAMWLNETSLVNADLYYSTHGTYGEFGRQEYLHTKYSVVLILVVIGICVVSGIVSQCTSLLPSLQKGLQSSKLWSKLRQNIFLPGLFGLRRLEPLPANAGYVPGRTISIFTAIYIILNIVFSSVNFSTFSPNIWFASPEFELCEYVGNRTGTLSLVNMVIAILFAGRNNLLIALTGWSQTSFLTLHRWAARIATVQAIVHSIVYTLAYFEPGSGGAEAYAAKAAEPFYYWGIIATIAFCLATALAILPLRIKYYEFFLITHIVLVVIVLVGCWYHIVPHFGFDYGYQVWLYIAFAFWSFDRVARIARIAYYNRIGNSRATIEAIPGCDIVQLTVFPRTWSFGPGQHTFVYFPGIGKFWESHPFSVAGWKTRGQTTSAPITRAAFPGSDEKEIQVKNSALHSVDSASPTASAAASQRAASSHANQVQEHTSIQFLVRVHAGVTSTLRNRIASSPSGTRTEISAYTEGPHAGHRATLQSLWVADTVLCLAGGIGITNALGFIQEFANLSHHGGEAAVRGRGIMRNTKRFILAWSARESGLIEHVKRNFLVDVEGIEYSFWHTGTSAIATQTGDSLHDDNEKSENLVSATIEGYTAGRMDIGSVIRSSVEPGHQTTVLVCGPGHMADEATQQVVNCLKDGHKIDLIEEAYAW